MALDVIINKLSNAFVKSAVRVEKVKTDTLVFRLHYKLSIWLVALYSIIYNLGAKRSITCLSNAKKLDKNAVEEYCWAHGTFTITNLDELHGVYPGIGTLTGNSEVEYHQYYKWMYVYILAQILLLLLPRKIWYSIEKGLMKRLVGNLNKVLPSGEKETIDRERDNLIEFLSVHMGYNRAYAFGFVFASVLNVLVTMACMFIWDYTTGHEFSRHGAPLFSIFQTPFAKRSDSLALIFPYLGKCTFKTHGPGGSIQPHDILCVLSLNVFNERAAIFFWYYFMALLPIGIFSLIFRTALIFSPRLRVFQLSGLTPLTSADDVAFLSKRCSYSDWFVIYQLGLSIEPMMFRQVLKGFIKKLPDRIDA